LGSAAGKTARKEPRGFPIALHPASRMTVSRC